MRVPSLESLLATALRTMVRRAVYSIPRPVFWTLFALIIGAYVFLGDEWLNRVLLFVTTGVWL